MFWGFRLTSLPMEHILKCLVRPFNNCFSCWVVWYTCDMLNVIIFEELFHSRVGRTQKEPKKREHGSHVSPLRTLLYVIPISLHHAYEGMSQHTYEVTRRYGYNVSLQWAMLQSHGWESCLPYTPILLYIHTTGPSIGGSSQT